MFKNFLRPRWQHPDVAVRRKALAEEAIESADCQALAINDPDTGVREQAIRQLDSVDRLLAVVEAQPAVRVAVATRLAELLLDSSAASVGAQLEAAVAVVAETPAAERLARAASDPALRRAAVSVLTDPATLRQCVLQDRAVDVRLQALRQIADEAALQEIVREARGHDKAVTRAATRQLADLRARHERAAERARLLDALAALADAPALDPEALHLKRTRWQELADDADAAQRRRFAELAPRLDARLALLREVQQADRAHRAEREALLQRLRDLAAGLAECEPAPTRAAIDALREAWAQATPLRDPWSQRRLQEEWQEALDDLEPRLRDRERQARSERAIAGAVGDVEAELARGKIQAQQVEAARQRWTDLAHAFADDAALERPLQRLQQLVDRLAAEFGRQQDRLRTLRARLKDAIEALEAALQHRQLEAAAAAHRKAHALLDEAGGSSDLRPLQRRLAKSEPLLRELQSWRNWGSDHAREELLAEARALIAAEIDVAERARRLKELRARWKGLGSGGAKARRLWEAFDAACTAAYAPIRQDRKEQARQRERHLADRAGLCARLERLAAETDWSDPDWRAIDHELAQARRAWRSAGPTPHRQWDAIRQRFEQAVAGVEQHLAGERRHNFLQRQALVREAEALAGSQDMRQAVAEARRLRDAWQVTAASSRKDEHALWRAFTAALDAVFERDRTARDAFKAGLEEQRQRAEALCQELEQLARSEVAEPRGLRGELGRLSTDFGRLGPLPKQARQGLERRFEAAAKALRQRIAQVEGERDQQALRDCFDLHGLCEQIEALAQRDAADSAAVESLAARWQASRRPTTQGAVLEALEQRYAQAMRTLSGDGPRVDGQGLERHAARRQDICLDLEILRKQASPAQAKATRMQRQVALLEAAMKGSDTTPEEQVRRLQLEYLCLGPVPAEQQPILAERFARLFP